MKKLNMDSMEMVEIKKTEYTATIYDGRTHIERRVYADENGTEFVKINGYTWELWNLPTTWEIAVY